MSIKTQSIKAYQIVYPQVYSYILPNRVANEGSQKIGYTEKKDVDDRILQQVKTAAFKEKYEKLWSSPAFFKGGNNSFTDKEFHKFLEKNGIERKTNLGSEWFYFNGQPSKSKELFKLFVNEGVAAFQPQDSKIEYKLRFEQEDAVKKTLLYFKENKNGEFLWNAKPRFGKTLASYDLAKQLKAKAVLIVTNRPAIANSWFDDYERFVSGYSFISESTSLKNKLRITRQQYLAEKIGTPQITFLSLQDLKGSKYFGGDFDKLQWIAELKWDLLIVDEAHEGIDTTKTDDAFDCINRKHTLHLSGTPFKALANKKFNSNAIYNWTYLDEQKCKQIEIESGEIGEHTDLPSIKLFTYRISQMLANKVNEGIEIDGENHDYAFDLNEFFRVQNKKFVYENDVKEFLNNLSTNKKYPFSTPELRDELKHTFWYVGNRVDSVKALKKILEEHCIFKEYQIIVAAGDGKSFEEDDFKISSSAFERVKNAIKNHDKTITLSCSQLTTGITIKEWTAVLMLTDIKSPQLYMQAAFRAQNPFKELRNGKCIIKQSCYLFDFAPTRALEIYDSFANGLNTSEAKENNITELLNFFPVISEDKDGEMIELDAKQVLTFPNALAATEIVNARFMSNLLFNDTLNGVFHFPQEVENILNKMSEEKNKKVRVTTDKINLKDAKKDAEDKTAQINKNTEIILGKKIFGDDVKKVVAILLEENNKSIDADKLANKISDITQPLIAKYKEIYKTNQSETKEINKLIEEKIKCIAEEYNNSELKDNESLNKKIIETIEYDFVKQQVRQKQEEEVKKIEQTKEEEIRDRLRSFTRTIPMFIMANDNIDEITIENFDLKIDNEDFLELTGITKEEFHKLRDGFDYEEDGEIKTFKGVFNTYRFNASIKEFRLKKEQLADYFTAKDDIFKLIPHQKTNQIFTPKKVVQMMINQLEMHSPSLFTRTDSTFIDLYMKSGMYITEIVKKLFNNTRKHYNSDKQCLKHILEKQVFGLSPTNILHAITNSYIFGCDVDKNISRKNFIQYDLKTDAKNGVARDTLNKLFRQGQDMKFDAVVGNPPYQDIAKQQIYTNFYLASREIAKILCLIFPVGWQEPKTANNLGKLNNDEIKKDKQIIQIDNYQNVFSGISGAEWVNIILWEKGYDNKLNGKQKILINGKNVQFVELKTVKNYLDKPSEIIQLFNILQKTPNFKSLSLITSVRRPYGLSTDVIKDTKKYNLPDIYENKNNDSDIQLWCGRKIYYVPKNYPFPTKSIRLDKYKVFIPYAWGGMDEKTYLGGSYSDIIIASPNTACNETFLESGCFNNYATVRKHAKYIMTQFFRALLYLNKFSQHSTTSWSAIPIQDYSEDFWELSISEINNALFDKYGVPQDIRLFVIKNIQPKDETNIINFENN